MNCTSVLATFNSSSGIANGANGSASVPGGTFPSDGTYYWQAKATDNTSAASAFSSSRALVIDTTAPAFDSATVDGSTLVVTLDEPLNSGSTPAGSAFVVRQNGSAQASPTGVSVSGSTVTLTLATAVRNDDTVTVAYNQPGSGRIKDVAGNDAATFSAQAVTNNTASVAPDVPKPRPPRRRRVARDAHPVAARVLQRHGHEQHRPDHVPRLRRSPTARAYSRSSRRRPGS